MLKKEFPQVRVHMNCTVRPENCSDLEKLYDYTCERAMSLSMQFQAPWRPWDDADFAKVQKSVWNIMSKTTESYCRSLTGCDDQTRHWRRRQLLKDLYRSKGMLDYQKRPARYLRYCVAGIQRVEMTPSGSVFFCPFSKDVPVGNIKDFDYDFDALWLSASAENARGKVWAGKCHCWINCAVYPNVNLALEICEQKYWKNRVRRYLKNITEIRFFRLSVWQIVLFAIWLCLLPLIAAWGIALLGGALAARLFSPKKKSFQIAPFPKINPVSIVIANFRGRELLAECLPDTIRCLNCEAAPGSEILVVDDASGDESVAFLRSNFPEVRVISLAENCGYGAATAAGVREARNRIIFLLNSDVRLKAGCLAALLGWFRDPEVFAVQPKMFDWDGQSVNGGCNFRREDIHGYFGLENESNRADKKKAQAPMPSAYAIGGAVALDKVKWDLLCGFDPLFAPFCWEDVDLSYRARRRGWKVIYDPRAEVLHRHHATLSKFYRPDYKNRIEQRNEMIFIWKNMLGMNAILKHVLLFPRHLWWRFFERNEAGFGRAFLAAWARLFLILRARRNEYGFAKDPFREDSIERLN
jgi:GT2 family glycosyltransferase